MCLNVIWFWIVAFILYAYTICNCMWFWISYSKHCLCMDLKYMLSFLSHCLLVLSSLLYGKGGH